MNKPPVTKFSLRSFFTAISFLIVMGVVFFQYFLMVKKGVHVTFAREQIAHFQLFVEKAHEVKHDKIEWMIEAIKNYYPAGSKQVEGSSLDILVEESRQYCIEEIERIIAMKRTFK